MDFRVGVYEAATSLSTGFLPMRFWQSKLLP